MIIEQTAKLFYIVPHDSRIQIRLTESHIVSDVDAELLEVELKAAIVESYSRTVAIDFSAVRCFSSALIATLLRLRNRLDAGGGRLVLCGLNVRLADVMAVMNLDQAFEFRETMYQLT